MQVSEPDVDVVVVGLGAMGSQALWRLAHRGVRVLGLERFRPGHDRGSSHGESRVIRSAYSEGANYVPLIQRAWTLWDELARISGEPVVTRTGGLMIGTPDAPMVAGALRSAEVHGLEHELLSAADLRHRFDQHRVDDDMVGFHERAAGVLRPELAIRTAVRAALAAGAEVRADTTVHAVRADPYRPVVSIDGRDITARHVVVAAGAWLPRLAPALAEHCTVTRRVMGWFRPRRPEAYTPDRFPVFLRDDRTGRVTWYGCPALEQGTVKVALHTDPSLTETVDPDSGPRPGDGDDAAALSRIVADTLPGLDPQPDTLVSCMYTVTPDEHFLLGGRPDLPGLTLLGGFSGHGFKFASAVGEIAAELATTGRSTLPVGMFAPDRFEP